MPLEVDVNDRTPRTPCQTPGCHWPNFHVCLLGKPDRTKEVLRKWYAKNPNARFGPRSQSHKEAIAASQKERWRKIWDENKERDDKIIERYNQRDIGMKPIAAEFGMTYSAVRALLNRAAREGRVVLNVRGLPPGWSEEKTAS